MQPELSASRTNFTVESRTLSVRINRPFAAVYEFLVNPANWNQWAFGLGKSLRQSNGEWIADSDGGIVKVRFTPRNDFGVIDHAVIRPLRSAKGANARHQAGKEHSSSSGGALGIATVLRVDSEVQIYVPMRLIKNGTGCELLFTLFREPNITNERYNSDTNFVQRDLNGLKELLEK
jgi:hypothetical protein